MGSWLIVNLLSIPDSGASEAQLLSAFQFNALSRLGRAWPILLRPVTKKRLPAQASATLRGAQPVRSAVTELLSGVFVAIQSPIYPSLGFAFTQSNQIQSQYYPFLVSRKEVGKRK
ncbi:hypothetical protein VTI74DRAFT_1879 [Chaetomium olivicolor]